MAFITSKDKEMIDAKRKCPYCKSENVVWLISVQQYKCNTCGAHF